MQILQAIATSSTQTLDGHKGEGLVYCSADLPVAIQQEARHIGYSPDACGQTIYSLKKIDVSAKKWLMMNHTVPAVDYTGRSSYVSHTIAIDEQLLLNHFQEGAFIPSVFDFMRRFEWRSCWDETPKWLDHSEDLDASIVDAFRPEFFDGKNPLDPAPLLAFEYPDGANPTPKRAIWHFDGKNAEEMLEVFHHAWLCLDPWQGVRKHKEHLGEPTVSLLDSWRFPFTTNLRHGQSEDYQWIVASHDCPSIPRVDAIEPLRWTTETPDSIIDRIGRPLGDLLVERCVQGPEAWAQSELKLLLDKLKREYSEEAQIKSKGIKDQVETLVSDFKGKVDELKAYVASYEKEGFWSFDKEADIEETRHQIQKRERNAKGAAENLMMEYHEKADTVARLLAHGRVPGSDEALVEPDCFPEFLTEFDRLAVEYREGRRIVNICEIAKGWRAEAESRQEQKADLDRELSAAKRELEVARISDKCMSSQTPPTGKGGTPARVGKKSRASEVQPWHMVALSVFSILVILLVVWYIMSGRLDGKKNANSREAKPEIARREAAAVQENQNVLNEYERLKLDNRSLKAENERLKELKPSNHKSSDNTMTDSAVDSGDKSTEGGKHGNPEEQKSAPAGNEADAAPPTNGDATKNPGAEQPSGDQNAAPSATPAPSTGSRDGKSEDSKTDNTSKEN
jgi:hypothetical protein